MNLIADAHTHTIASTHAYGTLLENVREAARKGLYAVAITDHGPAMPGAPGTWYFSNLSIVPRYLEGVLVLRGEEANVTDSEGNLDLDPGDLKSLDWIVASLHGPTVAKRSPSQEEVTATWLAVAKRPEVNVIGHCGTAEFAFDYETVLPEFARNGKLVEINEGTFNVRKASVPNCEKILRLCKKLSVPVIVDSDAHFPTRVGSFENALALLEKVGFPEELVVNSSVERFETYLKQYTKVFRKA